MSASASVCPDSGENVSTNHGEEKPLTKLSKSARNAYESWWSGNGLDFWANIVEVNAELLHLGHHMSLPKLVQDVTRNLETLPDDKFTVELAIDVLAAAAMYGFSNSPLLSRAGQLVL